MTYKVHTKKLSLDEVKALEQRRKKRRARYEKKRIVEAWVNHFHKKIKEATEAKPAYQFFIRDSALETVCVFMQYLMSLAEQDVKDHTARAGVFWQEVFGEELTSGNLVETVSMIVVLKLAGVEL